MNTIGKILAFLNLIFAIVVGVLLVYNVAFRAPWKEKYEALAAQNRILEGHVKASSQVQSSIGDDYRNKDIEIDKLKQQLKDTEDGKSAFERAKLAELMEYKNKALEKDLVTQETLKNQERLVQEIALLNKTIKDRETFINTVQMDAKVALTKAQNYEQVAKARQDRSEALLETIKDLTQKLNRLETGASPDAVIIRNPNAPNPPVAVVNGKIERVDGPLVQITLGSDHGVNKNNTLDVYRLSPTPKYLGMIRIEDAHHQKSVARFIYTGNAAYRPQLQVDDIVTSKINR